MDANGDSARSAEVAGQRLWALVLAGGEGKRLQALTRAIAGAPIPKQYCRIAGDRSLLEALHIEPLWRGRPPAMHPGELGDCSVAGAGRSG